MSEAVPATSLVQQGAHSASISPTKGASGTIALVQTPAPRRAWQELMLRDRLAVPYQSPEWMEAACATGKYRDVSRHYTMANGAQFVLPLIVPAGMPDWASIAGSMPNAWGMGGLVGTEPLSISALEAILADLRGLGFLGVHIRPNPLQAGIWAAAKPGLIIPRRAHAIDLSEGFEAVWGRFTSRVRGVIRKAERNVQVEFDATGRLLPQFFALFEKSIERWAASQHEPLALARWRANRRDPLAKFEHITAAMPGLCQVGVAQLDGEPVSAILVLQGANANYSRGAMDAERIGNSGANELLHRIAIERAAEVGCKTYHMGESGRSTNLARFKEKLGAQPLDYAEYRLERLPVARGEQLAKSFVKRLIGFRDGR